MRTAATVIGIALAAGLAIPLTAAPPDASIAARTVPAAGAPALLAAAARPGTAGLALKAQTAQPIADAVRSAWAGAKLNIVESGEQMPEANYSFKPAGTSADVRTFGQILAHVAGANYEFCSAARGEKPPHAENAFDALATKAAIVKALGESMAYCDQAFTALTDRSAAETIDMPFSMGKGPRVGALIQNVGHLNEHYGNLVTYFRAKGMVPPSSKR